jgi:hypothetical protein
MLQMQCAACGRHLSCLVIVIVLLRVFCFEDGPNIVTVHYTFELFSDSLYIRDKHIPRKLLPFIRTITSLDLKTESINLWGHPLS